MNPRSLSTLRRAAGFPYVSGDEPPGGYSETLAGLFSPHEWG